MNGKTQSIPATVWQDALGVGADGRKKIKKQLFLIMKILNYDKRIK